MLCCPPSRFFKYTFYCLCILFFHFICFALLTLMCTISSFPPTGNGMLSSGTLCSCHHRSHSERVCCSERTSGATKTHRHRKTKNNETTGQPRTYKEDITKTKENIEKPRIVCPVCFLSLEPDSSSHAPLVPFLPAYASFRGPYLIDIVL